MTKQPMAAWTHAKVWYDGELPCRIQLSTERNYEAQVVELYRLSDRFRIEMSGPRLDHRAVEAPKLPGAIEKSCLTSTSVTTLEHAFKMRDRRLWHMLTHFPQKPVLREFGEE